MCMIEQTLKVKMEQIIRLRFGIEHFVIYQRIQQNQCSFIVFRHTFVDQICNTRLRCFLCELLLLLSIFLTNLSLDVLNNELIKHASSFCTIKYFIIIQWFIMIHVNNNKVAKEVNKTKQRKQKQKQRVKP